MEAGTSDPTRGRPAETVAGYLAAIAIFGAVIGAMWHPLRLIPLAVLLALVAVGIGGRNARLASWAVIICAVCFFIGVAAAVITSHPLW